MANAANDGRRRAIDEHPAFRRSYWTLLALYSAFALGPLLGLLIHPTWPTATYLAALLAAVAVHWSARTATHRRTVLLLQLPIMALISTGAMICN